MFSDRESHIKRQLSPFAKERSNSSFLMLKCPFHNDRSPSMWVNAKTGKFGCFGCSAHGVYDDLAARMNLEPYVRDPMRPAQALFRKVVVGSEGTSFDKSQVDKFTLTDLPPNKIWREISTNLLIKVGCQLATHKEYGSKFVFMPIKVRKELVGFTCGRLRKREGLTSFVNAKGSWVKTEGLFPFDYAINLMRKIGSKTIVLVEGQRDALRLLQNGIPAVCFMGTNTWTDQKSLLLHLAGVERAVLMLDGDDAGRNAYPGIAESVSKHLELIPYKLWSIAGSPYLKYAKAPDHVKKEAKHKLWDPFNCPQRIIDCLHDYF